MERKLALRMLDFIESLNIEILALRAQLQAPVGTLSKTQVDSLVAEANGVSAIRGSVRESWFPLRQQLQSDSTPEEALQQLLKIIPPKTDLN
jgi:hypothetical protein